MKRKAIFVSPETHRKFKLLAVERELTFEGLLTNLLQERERCLDIIDQVFDEELRNKNGVTRGTMDNAFLMFRGRIFQALDKE